MGSNDSSTYQIVFTFQRSKLLLRFRGVEGKEFRNLAMVSSIVVDAKLDVLAKGLIELGEVVFVFSNLADKVHGLLHKVLADDLEDFILLESLTGDVKRKIFGVDDTLDEVEVLGNEVLTVVHDEYTADVEFDVVALLL